MTFWILGALLLFFLQSLLPPMLQYVFRADPQIMAMLGPRDATPETRVYGQRAERALRNMGEALLVFLPLALLGHSVETAVLGAQVFVLARIAYVPAYVLGIPFLRSAIWTIGLAGLALMAFAVAG